MECMSPYYIRNENYLSPARIERLRARGFSEAELREKSYKYIRRPCGKCEACKSRYVTEWCNRLQIENMFAKTAWFITLTYADENENFLDPDTGELVRGPRQGFVRILNKSDFQHFFDNLRSEFPTPATRKHEDKVISYYATGEYGSKSGKQHFHFLLFTLKDYYSFDQISQFVFKHWKYGFYKIGSVTPRSIRYVCKYSLKQLGEDYLPGFEPFALISKGISKGYVDEFGHLHRGNLQNLRFSLGGGQYSVLPRYLKEKLYTKSERDTYAAQRAEEYEKNPDKGWSGRAYAESVRYQKYLVQKRKSEKDKL